MRGREGLAEGKRVEREEGKNQCTAVISIIIGVDDSTAPQDERPIYTLYTQDGAPCILVKTDAIFQLNYRTLRNGVKSVKITLPGIQAIWSQ